MVLFSCCCNYATVDHIAMQILNFLVLSVITARPRFFTLHISENHLPISSLNVRELQLN